MPHPKLERVTLVRSVRPRQAAFALEAAAFVPLVLLALALGWLALRTNPTAPEAGLSPVGFQQGSPAAHRVPAPRLIVIVESGRVEAVSALVRASEELSNLLLEERRSINVVQADSPAAADRVATAVRDDFGQFVSVEAIAAGQLSNAEAPP